MTEEEIEIAAANAITEKPLTITLGGQEYEIKPPTIGKLEVLSTYIIQLEFDSKIFDGTISGEDIFREAMRICQDKADIACRLMAAATFDKKENLLNDKEINERAELLKFNSEPKDFAKVVIFILSQTQASCENFINSTRLMQTLRLNKPKV